MEEVPPEPDDAGRITRKKKTPAEMQQALQQQEEEEEEGENFWEIWVTHF